MKVNKQKLSSMSKAKELATRRAAYKAAKRINRERNVPLVTKMFLDCLHNDLTLEQSEQEFLGYGIDASIVKAGREGVDKVI